MLIQQIDVHKCHGEAACQLTIRLRYCGKRQGKDQIFQRNPSCPACCHKTAASPTPENEQSNQNIDVTQPQVLKNDTQRVLGMIEEALAQFQYYLYINEKDRTHCICINCDIFTH